MYIIIDMQYPKYTGITGTLLMHSRLLTMFYSSYNLDQDS